jgi:hypothetical protein
MLRKIDAFLGLFFVRALMALTLALLCALTLVSVESAILADPGQMERFETSFG